MKISKRSTILSATHVSDDGFVVGVLYHDELCGYVGWKSSVIQLDPAENGKRCGAAKLATLEEAHSFMQKLQPNRTNLTVYNGLSYITEIGRISHPWKYWADRGRDGYDLFYFVFDPSMISYEVVASSEASPVSVAECRNILESETLGDIYPELESDEFDDFFRIFSEPLASIVKGDFIRKYPTFNDILQAAIDPLVDVFVDQIKSGQINFIEHYNKYLPEEIRDEVLTKVQEQLDGTSSDDIVTI